MILKKLRTCLSPVFWEESPHSLEGFLKLPISERVFCGFYRTPMYLGWDEWDEFEKYAKKNFPIQFFFRETVGSQIRFFWYRFNNGFYYLKCALFKRYNVIKLPISPTCHDPDILIEEVLKKILFDFVEIEMENCRTDWAHETMVPKTKAINETYITLKHTIPKLQKEYDVLLHKFYGNGGYPRKENPEELKKLNDLEREIEEKKTDAFIQIILLRGTLWT